MLIKSLTFNEEKLKKLIEFYSTDVDDFYRVILWNRYYDNNIEQKNTIEIINICNPRFISKCF